MSPQTSIWAQLNDAEQDALLSRPAASQDSSVERAAREIVAEVRENGDAAIRSLTEKFDQIRLDALRVDDSEADAAERSLSKAQLAAIDTAIANVRRFHEAQIAAPLQVETSPGVVCRRVTHAIESVGLYVPAGTAPLPSAALMLAVPAAIAECPTRILCTPPRPDGFADPAVVVAAKRAGVTEIYKVGGAQAVAAMAYGTETIPAVRKIFGPGNAWVTAAKAIVSADPRGAAIDMPAGPSEVLVIGDASANPEFVAADLLSQAEHGVDSQAIFITTSASVASAVCEQIDVQLAALSRAEIAAEAIRNSRIILTEDLDTAIAVSNRYAPEHLILQIENASGALPAIRNAGSVFVGPWTPESVGDYCSGTNHVLPTYGYAASYSGLGVEQFRRSMTIQELSRDGLAGLRDTVVTLAGLEGLDAHAAAVTRRLESAK